MIHAEILAKAKSFSSHVGIISNEDADKSTKSARNLPISDFIVPYTDFKPSVLTHIQSSWQSEGNGDRFSKLHSVKLFLGEWYPSYYRSVRNEEVIITRLRIGHSYRSVRQEEVIITRLRIGQS